MLLVIGFVIALAVGLTGIGGGSFTVPALVLLVGLPAASSVGTAFVFAGVLRLSAAPFYLAGRHMHWRYLWLLVKGAVPGLLIGTFFLRLLSTSGSNPIIVVLLGVILTASSSVSFMPRLQNRNFAQKNSRWLPWLALPIGVEAGFSSACEFGPNQAPIDGIGDNTEHRDNPGEQQKELRYVAQHQAAG